VTPLFPDSRSDLPRRRGLLRAVFLYGVARGATEGLLALRGLLLATLLGPAAFGGWVLFRIATRYGAFAGLGVTRGMEREVAQERPPHDLSARTALGFGLATFSALGGAALAASFVVNDARLVLGMRAFAAGVIAEQAVVYALTYVRSRGDLRRFALLELASAALHVLVTTALALAWGLAGAFAGFSLASACTVGLCLGRAPFRPALSGSRLRRLLHVGFPQALTTLLGTALGTADKLVVAALGGATQLGYYAFATSVAALAASLAWVIRTVIFPEVYGRARAEGRGATVRDHLDRTVLPFAWLYSPLLGALALAVGPAVALALPQYAGAIDAARLFVFTGTTAGLATLGSLAIVAADRQRVLPLLTALAMLCNLTFSFLALRLGAGLAGVAAGAVLSQAIYAASILRLSAREGGLAKPARFTLGAMLPLAWSACAVFALGRLTPGVEAGPVALSAGLYALWHLPLAGRIRKEARKLTAASPSAEQPPPGAKSEYPDSQAGL
jgi:O-antigen/teichoic acid export membrane protein